MTFYFREKDLEQIERFYANQRTRAMAVYGRRRTGKTTLVLKFIENKENCVYFQVTDPNTDYHLALSDFKRTVISTIGEDPVIDSLKTFRDLFVYLNKTGSDQYLFIIDEFPYIVSKHPSAVGEFQWIIDHGLGKNKLILMGSNKSFMKEQISDDRKPLYGRFDEILEVFPFTYDEVHQLFPEGDDALNVYSLTYGVTQYVVFFLDYENTAEAVNQLYLRRNGRLFQEPANLLRQELRDIGPYIRILRAIGADEKEPSDIASKSDIDSKAIYQYLNKLEELEVIETVHNPLPGKKNKIRRYRIRDLFFRFMYTFIEPNSSLIVQIEEKAYPYVFNQQFTEYQGRVYEDLIRHNLYQYALDGVIPFMPKDIGKWWGNVQLNGEWAESEVDLLAIDDHYAIVGECKYRSKKIGQKELDLLKTKVNFIPVKGRKVIWLLASKTGFTDDAVPAENVLLIKGTKPLNSVK